MKSALKSDLDMQNSEFALFVFGLAFGLAFVQDFITTLPLLSFGMVMYIQGHCMLEVGDLIFHFDFTEYYFLMHNPCS